VALQSPFFSLFASCSKSVHFYSIIGIFSPSKAYISQLTQYMSSGCDSSRDFKRGGTVPCFLCRVSEARNRENASFSSFERLVEARRSRRKRNQWKSTSHVHLRTHWYSKMESGITSIRQQLPTPLKSQTMAQISWIYDQNGAFQRIRHPPIHFEAYTSTYHWLISIEARFPCCCFGLNQLLGPSGVFAAQAKPYVCRHCEWEKHDKHLNIWLVAAVLGLN